jgi:hypothetical protein
MGGVAPAETGGVAPAETGGAAPDEAGGQAPAETGDPPAEPSAVEVLWTIGTLGPAPSLVAAIRRADRGIVMALEAGVIVEGDIAIQVAAALEDPSVAAVGAQGLASTDLHRFTPAGPGDPVVALGSALLAFRREDAARLAPIDERLVSYAGVVAWSSLALREAAGGMAARRAVALDLPLRVPTTPDDVERRDRYRISARFRDEVDLRA